MTEDCDTRLHLGPERANDIETLKANLQTRIEAAFGHSVETPTVHATIGYAIQRATLFDAVDPPGRHSTKSITIEPAPPGQHALNVNLDDLR